MPITRDPETNDVTVSVTFTKEQMPYLREWYFAAKNGNETVQGFIHRIMIEAALTYMKTVERQVEEKTRIEAIQAMQKGLEDEEKIIKQSLGI